MSILLGHYQHAEGFGYTLDILLISQTKIQTQGSLNNLRKVAKLSVGCGGYVIITWPEKIFLPQPQKAKNNEESKMRENEMVIFT